MPIQHPFSRFAAVAVCTICLSPATAGTPYPAQSAPQAVDQGPLSQAAGNQPVTVTIVLKLPDPDAAEDLLRHINTPGDPQFHQFLTPKRFQAEFGPTEADVAKVSAQLSRYGLEVARASGATLHATGTPASIEAAFAVSLHQYQVPAADKTRSYSYHAPLQKPAIPEEIASLVHSVLGLDTKPSLKPLHSQAPSGWIRPDRLSHNAAIPPDAPGLWTVTDFADYYNVTPLYKKGLKGGGRTVGIMTFASFTPSDAFTYWQAVGLNVDQDRLRIADIDGGPGAPSDASGSDETTLDVEQSGGVAPAASIIVYQGPNTNQGFIDVVAAAVEANEADSLSISWGDWEWLENLGNSPVIDPSSGHTTGLLRAGHELFLRAALQGQSIFAAAGDNGAYDSTGVFPPPDFSLPFSVDWPGSDPLVTSSGGTTLPGDQTYTVPNGTLVINVQEERVWGWDYLIPYCTALSQDPITCGIFSIGSGGGVSVFFPVPDYQLYLKGVQRSEPGQAFIEYLPPPAQIYYDPPAYFRGRNVPDVAMNADPQTGYLLYYTSDVNGFGIQTYGGTSFVAPQLNGVTALLGQDEGHRLGLLNYSLYRLNHEGWGAPLRYITEGDNWFYTGQNNYSPAAGLGTINVDKLAEALKKER